MASRAPVPGLIARWIGAALGALLALALFAVALVYFGLQTAPGGRLVRGIVVKQVNKTISGHLDLQAVEFRGRALTLRGIELRDPDGLPAARLARLTVSYGLAGLLGHRIDIRSVDLERPEILLRQDGRGLNLSRALADRHPQPPSGPATEGRGWQINLGRLGIVAGLIEYQATHPGRPQFVHRVENLASAASARFHTTSKDTALRLALAASIRGTSLVPGPIAINAHLEGRGGIERGTADVLVGDLLALAVAMRDPREADVQLRLRIPPALVASVAPDWPVSVPLALSGHGGIHQDVIAFDLTARGEGASGQLSVRGDATSGGDRTPGGIRVVARDLVLSQLVRNVRAPIPLAFSATVEPGPLRPGEMNARTDLDVPRITYARHAYGPLHLEGQVAAGRLRALAMSLPVPGARLSAQGGTTGDRTTVTTRFVIQRLATLRAALASLDIALPPVQGRGSLLVTARGDNVTVAELTGWSVEAQASLPRLNVSGSQYRGITLHVSLPQLAPSRQSIAVQASLAAPLPVTVALSALTQERVSPPLDETHPRIDVELLRLLVSYPGTRWKNDGPAWLTANGDALSLRNLFLRAGEQAVAVNLARDTRALSANLRVQALRLQALPGMRARKIAGTVDATVTALGTPAAPRVNADVSLRDGRMEQYEGLSAHIVATLADDHTVSATARAAMAHVGHLDASLRGPATWPPPRNAPLAVTIDARDLRLGRLSLPPAAQLKADGVLGAHVDLRGTAANPQLAVAIDGKKLRIERGGTGSARPALGFRDVKLLVTYAAPSLLGKVALDDDDRGTLRARVKTRIPAADLTTPARLALGQRPLVGSLELKNMNPEGISALVPTLEVVRGEITAAFEIRGTVARPDIGGEINWRKGDLVVVKAADRNQAKGTGRKVTAP